MRPGSFQKGCDETVNEDTPNTDVAIPVSTLQQQQKPASGHWSALSHLSVHRTVSPSHKRLGQVVKLSEIY